MNTEKPQTRSFKNSFQQITENRYSAPVKKAKTARQHITGSRTYSYKLHRLDSGFVVVVESVESSPKLRVRRWRFLCIDVKVHSPHRSRRARHIHTNVCVYIFHPALRPIRFYFSESVREPFFMKTYCRPDRRVMRFFNQDLFCFLLGSVFWCFFFFGLVKKYKT